MEPWILTSLSDLQRTIGEVIGTVRSQHDATNRRIDELREEMAGRLANPQGEARRSSPSPPPAQAPTLPAQEPSRAWARLLDIAKGLPWTHIATLAALGILGLLGHVSPADIRKYLLGG